ncbi:hypothetical protein CMI48_00045 [Candidatus Pacearchaeota archaeon]|nr:hypothetical protein [Candidatus Pacearchaeota archaeon]|tara:strand:- start:674 stop:1108 length:435 start_codon:yes stop_codon:yes gene_type:complete
MNKKLLLLATTLLAIILAINVVSAYSYFTPHNYGFENTHQSYTKTYQKSVNYHPYGYDKTVVISKDYRPNSQNNYGYYGNKYTSNYYGNNRNTGYWGNQYYNPNQYQKNSRYYYHGGDAHKDYTSNYYYKPHYNSQKSHYDWRY